MRGSRVTIIGKSLPWLVMRIKKPMKYWSMVKEHVRIRLWILTLIGDAERANILERIDELQDNLQQLGYLHNFQGQDNLNSNGWAATSDLVKYEIDQLYEALIRTKKPSGNWIELDDVWHESGTSFNTRGKRGPIAATDHWMTWERVMKPEWLVCTDNNTELIEFLHLDALVNKKLYVEWLPTSLMRVSQNGLSTTSVNFFSSEAEVKIKLYNKSYRARQYVSPFDQSLDVKAWFGEFLRDEWCLQLSVEI